MFDYSDGMRVVLTWRYWLVKSSVSENTIIIDDAELSIFRGVIGFFFSGRRRHTRWTGDWSSDVCSSDLARRRRRSGRPVRHVAQLREAAAARQHAGPEGPTQERGAADPGVDGGVEQGEGADGNGEPTQDDQVVGMHGAALDAEPGTRRGAATRDRDRDRRGWS